VPCKCERSADVAGEQSSGGTDQTYVYTVASLTRAKALKFANARAREIALMERTVEIDAPGELPSVIDTLIPLQLAG
jgi:hypothetical protein